MELAIPGVALGLLYIVSKQNGETETKNENFTGYNGLPNTNIPDKNYPSELPIVSSELDKTSALSQVNRFDSNGVYTDKYFNQKMNKEVQDSVNQPEFFSMTGEKVGKDYFQHDNMVPFFGSKLRTVKTGANSNEGIMDSHTGAGSQSITKTEQAPLFKPDENVQWAHGAPNQTDFIRSRVNPSMKMSNVKPFEEERVAPGLGLGYTNEGADGFNAGMMERDQWMPKTADQLRITTNPKAGGNSLLGHEGPANSSINNHISTREQMGVMEKNRPETSFEMNSDRYMTTTGAVKGQTLHSIPIDRYVSRPETTTSYTGAAGADQEASYVAGEYMPSHNQQLGPTQLGVANANNRQQATASDYGIKSKKAYPNNRTSNKQDGYFGMVSGTVGAAIAPLLDVLRPSRKENVIGTLRPYQNAGSTVSNSYIFNPADRPAATIRETTEKSKNHLNINANQNGGAYQVSDQQVAFTTRNETGDFYYTGAVGATDGNRELKSYEAIGNQRNNDMKSSTIDGRMTKGNMSLMNADVNMRQKTRDESFKNNRDAVGNMPYQSPDVSNIGRISGNNNTLPSTVQAERNDWDISSQLQSNPYVVNYKKGL
jgi:hypothetical protein|tara:strand:+ start:8171 stop:9967 length:1797 start_codon:yes stop_codon:yes gene_type:complete